MKFLVFESRKSKGKSRKNHDFESRLIFLPSTAKTIGKKSETDFSLLTDLINFENPKIEIADENSLTFPKNYDIVYIQIIQKEAKRKW